jgi:hypothetical protein
LGCALLGALCLYKAAPPAWRGGRVHPAATGAAAPAPRTRNIEDIRVGDRVLADGVGGERDLSLGGEVDPATWRRIELRARKRDGGWADVVLLRPAWWLEQQGVKVGGLAPLAVPECGIDGRAEVLSVGPCPPLKPGKGAVVTGTFGHTSARVVDVHVEGLREPVGATPNHLFWSEDRRAFVRADDLRGGERLRGGAGTLPVTSVVPRVGLETVFNLEARGRHVYHVGKLGILVHNAAADPLAIINAVVNGRHTVHHMQIPANGAVPITDAPGITFLSLTATAADF